MSKVSRKKLARGVALKTEHVFQPLSDIGTSVSISDEQVGVKWAPFRLNFSVPVINSGAGVARASWDGLYGTSFCIPFMVPPLQGYFEDDQKTRNNTPQVILDELAFSFDSRAEAAAIRMYGGANSADYNLDFSVLDRLNVDISIVEKSTSFGGNDEYDMSREVESIRLKSLLFKDTTERLNPIVVDDLNKSLDPYKSYLLKITASDLWSGVSSLPPASATSDNEEDAPMFVSVNVSLRLRHPLVAKTPYAGIQNAPSATPGAEALGIESPSATDPITADLEKGVSTEIKKVDDLIHRGLDGGTSKDSLPTPYSHLVGTSGYEVIAVPMWGNFSRYQTLSSKNADRLPYGDKITCDRRVIPINYPVIIHHVIAGVNYNDIYGFGTFNPESLSLGGHYFGHPQVDFKHAVGVAIATGLRSDTFTYQQVAHHSWTNDDGAGTDKTLNIIDKMRYRKRYPGLSVSEWDFELMSIPMTNTGSQGTGFVTQGQPFYAGKGVQLAGTAVAREDCGDGVIPFPGTPQTPVTSGAEQFIEIRWQMSDPVDLRESVNGALTGKELYIGTGGHWVYLICEKLLVGGDGDLKV